MRIIRTLLAVLLFEHFYLFITAFKIIYDQIEIIPNPSCMKWTIIKLNNTNITTFNFDSYLLREVKNIDIKIKITSIRQTGKSVIVFNTRWNACKFSKFAKNEGHFFLMRFFEKLNDSGNLTKASCPYQSGYYYGHNIEVDENVFPSFTPNGKHEFQFTAIDVFDKTKPILCSQFTMKVRTLRKQGFKMRKKTEMS